MMIVAIDTIVNVSIVMIIIMTIMMFISDPFPFQDTLSFFNFLPL